MARVLSSVLMGVVLLGAGPTGCGPDPSSESLFESKHADEKLRHVKDATDRRTLCLDRSDVTDGGLELVGSMTRLRVLTLIGTRITDAGLAHLKDRTYALTANPSASRSPLQGTGFKPGSPTICGSLLFALANSR